MSKFVTELYDDTFDDAIATNDVVLVDFYADWCGPCRALAPVVERTAREYAGRVAFAKLNTDGNPAAATRYNVSSIPTLILFRGGHLAARIGGYQSDAQLRGHLDRYAAAPAPGAPSRERPPAGGLLSRLLGRR